MSKLIATHNTLAKNAPNGWSAESRYPLVDTHEGTRVLEITTYKASNGALSSQASVMLHTPSGSRQHAYSLGAKGSGDFSERLMQTRSRATEKTVGEQHAQVCLDVDAIAARAFAHYAGQESAQAINDRRDRELQEQDRAARGMNYIERGSDDQDGAVAA